MTFDHDQYSYEEDDVADVSFAPPSLNEFHKPSRQNQRRTTKKQTHVKNVAKKQKSRSYHDSYDNDWN